MSGLTSALERGACHLHLACTLANTQRNWFRFLPNTLTFFTTLLAMVQPFLIFRGSIGYLDFGLELVMK